MSPHPWRSATILLPLALALSGCAGPGLTQGGTSQATHTAPAATTGPGGTAAAASTSSPGQAPPQDPAASGDSAAEATAPAPEGPALPAAQDLESYLEAQSLGAQRDPRPARRRPRGLRRRGSAPDPRPARDLQPCRG